MMLEIIIILSLILNVFLVIKVFIMEGDIETLYRAICWLDTTKQERLKDEVKNYEQVD